VFACIDHLTILFSVHTRSGGFDVYWLASRSVTVYKLMSFLFRQFIYYSVFDSI
jgi:hypothetical protein